MLGLRSYYKEQTSIPQTIREDAELDNDLEDMDICDDNEFSSGMILINSKSQEQLKSLHKLIVKRDSLKIRLPTHWEMDLIFTEILSKENFGNYGNSSYEIMLPYEFFMVENIHYKGLVRFKAILNLPNKIRGMTLTNKNEHRKISQFISSNVAAYINWLIDLSFNTQEGRRTNLKLFKNEYLIITKSEVNSKTKIERDTKQEILNKSENHLVYCIDIANSNVFLNVFDDKKQFKLIKFNLKRNFQRVQKLQNQVDIEFSLKLTMFIEMARKEMIEYL